MFFDGELQGPLWTSNRRSCLNHVIYAEFALDPKGHRIWAFHKKMKVGIYQQFMKPFELFQNAMKSYEILRTRFTFRIKGHSA